MRIILDENLPQKIKEEIQEVHGEESILDVNEEYKGILDLELLDKMKEEDIMITRDKELHKNLLKIGKKSIYYDIEIDNLVEVQIKLYYYLKGLDSQKVHKSSDENEDIRTGPNSILRKRYEELKKENSKLKSRVNVLEGKIKSISNTVQSVLED